jgi:O-antigen/teichoic acid export membrane protein
MQFEMRPRVGIFGYRPQPSFPFPDMPSENPSISRSAVWHHLGKVADFALLYVVSVIIARGLGLEAYGRYAALLSGVNLLLVASSFGLEASLTRHCASLAGTDILERIRFLLRRSAVVRTALLLASAFLLSLLAVAVGWITLPGDLTVTVLLAGFALSRTLVPLSSAVLVSRFDTARVALVSVAGRMVEVGGLLLPGSRGLTIPLVLEVLFAAGIAQVLLHLIVGSRYWVGREERSLLAPVLGFGALFWLNSLVDYFLGRQGDVALLSLLKGDPGATSRYDVSYTLLQVGAMVTTLGLSGVSLAALSRLSVGDLVARKDLYEKLVRVNSFLTIPVLGFIFAAAPEILAVVYTGPFVQAASVLRILVAIRIASRIFAGGENADLLLSMDKVGPLVAVGAVGAIATIMLHLLLIPPFSAEGAAFASGLGSMAANVLGVGQVRRNLPVDIQWRSWIRVVLCTVCGVASVAAMRPAASSLVLLALAGGVFIAGWFIAALIVKPLDRGDAFALARSVPWLERPIGLVARGGGAT